MTVVAIPCVIVAVYITNRTFVDCLDIFYGDTLITMRSV